MEKTLSLLLIIGLGLVLQSKIKSPEHLKGVKVLILSVALPATIFVALLNVKIDQEMLLLPVLGLLVNGVLLGVFYFTFKFFVPIQADNKRTLLMLMPSLAPGLSCFPFISEYLGSDALAMAALADVGNKVFVLILLYLLAMHWYYHRASGTEKQRNRLRELLTSLIKEPINMVIVLAFVLLALGINMDSLPSTLSSLLVRLSAMMAPLVLLFIGMAVKIKRNDMGVILRMLVLRSGLAFLLSAVLIGLLPNLTSVMVLLLLVFVQSSASFWPFAHISVVNQLEDGAKTKTFNGDLALSVLALSLPFSTFVILGILSVPSIAVSPIYPAMAGLVLIFLFLLGPIWQWAKGIRSMKHQELEVPQNTATMEEQVVG